MMAFPQSGTGCAAGSVFMLRSAGFVPELSCSAFLFFFK
jgi:hypothetical protein